MGETQESQGRTLKERIEFLIPHAERIQTQWLRPTDKSKKLEEEKELAYRNLADFCSAVLLFKINPTMLDDLDFTIEVNVIEMEIMYKGLPEEYKSDRVY